MRTWKNARSRGSSQGGRGREAHRKAGAVVVAPGISSKSLKPHLKPCSRSHLGPSDALAHSSLSLSLSHTDRANKNRKARSVRSVGAVRNTLEVVRCHDER